MSLFNRPTLIGFDLGSKEGDFTSHTVFEVQPDGKLLVRDVIPAVSLDLVSYTTKCKAVDVLGDVSLNDEARAKLIKAHEKLTKELFMRVLVAPQERPAPAPARGLRVNYVDEFRSRFVVDWGATLKACLS